MAKPRGKKTIYLNDREMELCKSFFGEDSRKQKGCAVCSAGERKNGNTLLLCSKCKVEQYCSEEHQLLHWSKHKEACAMCRRIRQTDVSGLMRCVVWKRPDGHEQHVNYYDMMDRASRLYNSLKYEKALAQLELVERQNNKTYAADILSGSLPVHFSITNQVANTLWRLGQKELSNAKFQKAQMLVECSDGVGAKGKRALRALVHHDYASALSEWGMNEQVLTYLHLALNTYNDFIREGHSSPCEFSKWFGERSETFQSKRAAVWQSLGHHYERLKQWDAAILNYKLSHRAFSKCYSDEYDMVAINAGSVARAMTMRVLESLQICTQLEGSEPEDLVTINITPESCASLLPEALKYAKVAKQIFESAHPSHFRLGDVLRTEMVIQSILLSRDNA